MTQEMSGLAGRKPSRLRLASIVAFGMGCVPIVVALILKDPFQHRTALDSVFFVALVSIPFVGGRVLLTASTGASVVVALSGYAGLLVSQGGAAILSTRSPETGGSLGAMIFLLSAPAIVIVYWLVVHWVSKWGRDPAIRDSLERD